MLYLQEGLPQHPKIVGAGQLIGGKDGRLVALGLFVDALDYARNHCTDGVVPASIVNMYPRRNKRKLAPATALTKVNLFERSRGGHYRIHDYHDWNPTAAEVKEAKRVAAARKAKWRADRKARPRRSPNGTAVGQVGDNGVPETYKIQIQDPDPDPGSKIQIQEREVLALWSHYAERFSATTGEPPHCNDRRDLPPLQALLEEGIPPDVIRDAITVMFIEGDAFVQDRGYPLPLFGQQFNTYLAKLGAARPARPWYWNLCPHDPKCTDWRACKARQQQAHEETNGPTTGSEARVP